MVSLSPTVSANHSRLRLQENNSEPKSYHQSFDMGCELSVDFIVRQGTKILNAFFSKNLLGQMLTAIQAPSECKRPDKDEVEEVSNFMECQFLKSQKGPWEMILCLQLFSLFAIVVLGVLLYKKTKQSITNLTARNDTKFYNLNLNRAIQGVGPMTRVRNMAQAYEAKQPSFQTRRNLGEAAETSAHTILEMDPINGNCPAEGPWRQ